MNGALMNGAADGRRNWWPRSWRRWTVALLSRCAAYSSAV